MKADDILCIEFLDDLTFHIHQYCTILTAFTLFFSMNVDNI